MVSTIIFMISQFHSKMNGCSYPGIIVSVEVCLCLLLVELTYMRFRNFHMQRYTILQRQTLSMSGTAPEFLKFSKTEVNIKLGQYLLSGLEK
jgi:hypothetical protein